MAFKLTPPVKTRMKAWAIGIISTGLATMNKEPLKEIMQLKIKMRFGPLTPADATRYQELLKIYKKLDPVGAEQLERSFGNVIGSIVKRIIRNDNPMGPSFKMIAERTLRTLSPHLPLFQKIPNLAGMKTRDLIERLAKYDPELKPLVHEYKTKSLVGNLRPDAIVINPDNTRIIIDWTSSSAKEHLAKSKLYAYLTSENPSPELIAAINGKPIKKSPGDPFNMKDRIHYFDVEWKMAFAIISEMTRLSPEDVAKGALQFYDQSYP